MDELRFRNVVDWVVAAVLNDKITRSWIWMGKVENQGMLTNRTLQSRNLCFQITNSLNQRTLNILALCYTIRDSGRGRNRYPRIRILMEYKQLH